MGYHAAKLLTGNAEDEGSTTIPWRSSISIGVGLVIKQVGETPLNRSASALTDNAEGYDMV